jgi:hypothetical protein
MSSPPNADAWEAAASEEGKSLAKAARAGRIVTFVWLVWAVFCPEFLWIGRTYGIESAVGFIGVLGIGLWCAVSALPVLLLVPVAFHEIGHLIAGLSVGYRPEMLIIGPWGWRRMNGRLRFYWTGEWLSFGGLAGGSLKSGRRQVMQDALYTLGGPLASLIMAIPGAMQGYQMAILRPFFHTPLPPRDGGLLTPVLLVWGFISATALIGSLMPFRSGPLRSDGSNLWILLRGGKAAERYAAVAAMATDLRLGGLSADWLSNWVEDATALPDGKTDDAFGCYFAYYWHLAMRDYPSAGKMILRAVAAERSLPADYRTQAHLETAYYYLHFDGDLDKAKTHFEKGKGSPLATHERVQAIQKAIECA